MIYIFDLGGVIIKSQDLKKIYDELKPKVDYATFIDIWYNDREVIDAHKGLNDEKESFRNVLEKIGCKISVDELFNIVYKKRDYYEDTLNIINKLRNNGKKVYLLSNLRKIDFEYLKKDIDISIFDKTFLSYEMNLIKPQKEIYETVIEELNINPSNIYFFDDNRANINSSIQCGIKGFCVTGDNIKEVFQKNKLLSDV